VSLEAEGPAPPGNRPQNQAAAKQLDASILSRATDIAPAYIVVEETAEALAAGVPPLMAAEALMLGWAHFAAGANDAEITDAMWRQMVSPRVQAILGGEWSA